MMHKRLTTVTLAAVMALSLLTFAGARPAHAENSKETISRVATYGLGAATVYSAVKGKGTLALIGAAGTYLAHQSWKNEVDKRNRRDNRRYYSRHRR